MPIYEYECQACREQTTVEAKMSDPSPTECPKCHGGPMKKLISRTAFVLKGSGWYTTDYKKSSSSESSTPVATKSETQSETSTSSHTHGSGCAAGGCGAKN